MSATPARTLESAGFVNPKSLPRGPGGRALCRYCKVVECQAPRLTFCSDTCVHEHKIRSNPGYARSAVLARDRCICALCGQQCGIPRTNLEPAIMGPSWEADHIVPVVEGGGSCGLENLRTLCTKCHKDETSKLAARRAEAKRAQGPVTRPELRFTVEGEPVPKARARHRVIVPKFGKPFAQEYTPAETRAYEGRVRLVCQAAVSRAGWDWTEKDRFTVTMRVMRTHEGKGGDLDNYVKSVTDGMIRVAYPNDHRIRGIGAVLAEPDRENPRIEVTVRKI